MRAPIGICIVSAAVAEAAAQIDEPRISLASNGPPIDKPRGTHVLMVS